MKNINRIVTEQWQCSRGHKHMSEAAARKCAGGPENRDNHYLRMTYSAIIRLRLDGVTLKKTGEYFGISASRVRQIEAKCYRIARHPDRQGESPAKSTLLDEDCVKLLAQKQREEAA